MPSLEELTDPEKLDAFCKEVARLSQITKSVNIDVDGVKTTSELHDLLIKGKDTPFDYTLLINLSA